MATLTAEQRDKLRQQIAAFDDAINRIEAAMEPFRDARQAIEEAKELCLDQHEAVIAAHCEEGCLILEGERAHWCEDGPVWCEEHAPTWRDIKQQFEAEPDAFTDPFDQTDEERARAREALRAKLAELEAQGRLDEKHVW